MPDASPQFDLAVVGGMAGLADSLDDFDYLPHSMTGITVMWRR